MLQESICYRRGSYLSLEDLPSVMMGGCSSLQESALMGEAITP